jgi:hypothetical protein
MAVEFFIIIIIAINDYHHYPLDKQQGSVYNN